MKTEIIRTIFLFSDHQIFSVLRSTTSSSIKQVNTDPQAEGDKEERETDGGGITQHSASLGKSYIMLAKSELKVMGYI